MAKFAHTLDILVDSDTIQMKSNLQKPRTFVDQESQREK
jgi:hypothetical protein